MDQPTLTEPNRELPDNTEWPSVCAVVPTRDRPLLMRRAVESIVAQDYPGDIHVIAVFDQSKPNAKLPRSIPGRTVSVITNSRTPGLAGARNSGILEAGEDLVAFCDDDDVWEPQKLREQVEALSAHPEAEVSTTAMVVDYQDRSSVRLAGRSRVAHADLIRSRMAMLHSSSFLARRTAVLDGIGLVSESIPRSMAEDWDFLLRASERSAIVHVDRPLVRVQWAPSSYFAQQWEVKCEAAQWLVAHHPGITADRVGAGLMYGKLAFNHAMLGSRRETFRWAARSIRSHWCEPRAYLALAVAFRIMNGQWLVRQLNRRGHGI